MLYFSKLQLQQLEKVQRLNLINACTGYKSANLIVTKSEEEISNVAVFSSVTHLGSNPPLISFITRPVSVKRDTYTNLKTNPYFSINAITQDYIAAAHHTSASYEAGISEFEKTDLEEEFKENCEIGFVKNSPIQLYCKYINEYFIEENKTVLIIASIEKLFLTEEILNMDFSLQLDKAAIVSITGVDGYALPTLIDQFEYAKPDVKTKSKLDYGT